MEVFKLLRIIFTVVVFALLVIYLGDLLMLLVSAYILYSMLYPVKIKIQTKIKIKHSALSSLLALLFPSLILSLIILYIFPVIITQMNSLTSLSYKDVFGNIIQQFPFLERVIGHLGGKKYVLKSIEDTMTQVVNINRITQWSAILLNNFSHIVLNLLITFFITFHLLKDDDIPVHFVQKLIPDQYEKDVKEISNHIKEVLGKYFRGLLIDVFIIMTVNSTILSILGIKNAVLIGILSGILNIIPYVGPLITLFIGLFFGVSNNILEGQYELIISTVIKITITLVSVNIIDGTVIQPYIFSNVLKAHPLEIFLVIISAGMMGGIVWMMLIIPIYVIVRIVIKEIYIYRESKNYA